MAIEVIVFPGGFNWPLWIAEEKGFFAAERIAANLTPTPNSVFQIENLVAGKFHVAFTTFDNVVAYVEGQGEAKLAATPDLFAFMGAQYGAVRLVARPEIRAIRDLQGKSLAVDAATTGYAFVLRKIVQLGGLSEADYTLERVGGTAQRAQALIEGKTAATILTSPLEIAPEAKGYRRLANAVDAIGPYQAVCGAASRAWAREHAGDLMRFIRAYVAGLEWLSDDAHRDEAIAIYRKRVPQASEEGAQEAWNALVPGPEGFQRKAKIDLAGCETVLALRSEFGQPRKELRDASKYVDERYYFEATGSPPARG